MCRDRSRHTQQAILSMVAQGSQCWQRAHYSRDQSGPWGLSLEQPPCLLTPLCSTSPSAPRSISVPGKRTLWRALADFGMRLWGRGQPEPTSLGGQERVPGLLRANLTQETVSEGQPARRSLRHLVARVTAVTLFSRLSRVYSGLPGQPGHNSVV